MVSFDRSQVAPVLSLPLLRVKAGSSLSAVLMPVGPLFVGTHWEGRQVVCPGDDCPLCATHPKRVYGYSVVAVPTSSNRFVPMLLEMSLSTWSRFDGLLGLHGLGMNHPVRCTFKRRLSRSPLIAVPESEESPEWLPKMTMCRLVQAVAVLYQVSPMTEEESVEDWSARVHSAFVARAAAL